MEAAETVMVLTRGTGVRLILDGRTIVGHVAALLRAVIEYRVLHHHQSSLLIFQQMYLSALKIYYSINSLISNMGFK